MVLAVSFMTISMDSAPQQSAGVQCSDPNGSDWIEKTWVNGRAQFVLHTTRPTIIASIELEDEVNISASTANAMCYNWNNQ